MDNSNIKKLSIPITAALSANKTFEYEGYFLRVTQGVSGVRIIFDENDERFAGEHSIEALKMFSYANRFKRFYVDRGIIAAGTVIVEIALTPEHHFVTTELPPVGQAASAESVPVVLPAAQITALTPLPFPADYPLPAAQVATLTPPANPDPAQESGGNLDEIKLNTDNKPLAGDGFNAKAVAGVQALAAASTPCNWVLIQAYTTNTAYVIVSFNGTAGQGIHLSRGESITLPCSDLNDVMVENLVNNEGVMFIYG